MKLYRLPNGEWIDPDSVTAVRPLSGTDHDGHRIAFPPRVVIDHGTDSHAVIECQSDGHARIECDNIAADINKARSKGAAV